MGGLREYTAPVRMYLAPLCLLVGCNRIFGLEPTVATDAAFFDAPADAPFACPTIGTVPEFSRAVQQQVIQDCSYYTLAGDLAVAQCEEPMRGLAQGTASASTLAPIPELPISPDDTYGSYEPHLAPDGDVLLVRGVHVGASPEDTLELWSPNGTTWTKRVTLTPPATLSWSSYMRIGAPTRGPDRRVMLTPGSTDNTLRELAIDPSGATRLLGTYTSAELGVVFLNTINANLSGDGLRLVLSAVPTATSSPKALYSDRASLADRFHKLVPLVGVPAATDLVMNEDCSRVYFSAASSVFYELRQ